MEDKDKHINQQPDGNYPEPSVPAGDAWANMNVMLNQEMPVSKAAISGKYQLVKVLKFIIPAVTLLQQASYSGITIQMKKLFQRIRSF